VELLFSECSVPIDFVRQLKFPFTALLICVCPKGESIFSLLRLISFCLEHVCEGASLVLANLPVSLILFLVVLLVRFQSPPPALKFLFTVIFCSAHEQDSAFSLLFGLQRKNPFVCSLPVSSPWLGQLDSCFPPKAAVKSVRESSLSCGNNRD
jgi:hypothetical protein